MLLATGGGASAGSSVSAATTRGATLLAQAEASGPVVIYSGQDPVTAGKVVQAFRAAYPNVDVQFVRLVGSALVARYAAEAGAGQPQASAVIDVNQPFFGAAYDHGWMLKLDAKNVPNAKKLDPKFILKGNLAIAITRLNGVIANTDSVSPNQYPKKLSDLLKPMWKDKLVGGDPRTQPIVVAYWELLRKTFGDKFLQGMAKQNIEWVPSLVGGVQKVGAGEKWGAFGANILHERPLLASAPDAPITKQPIPTQPDAGFVWNAGVSTKAPNRAGALLFVNWLLTPAGQAAWNAGSGTSVLSGVKIPGVAPLGSKFNLLSTVVRGPVRSRVLKLLGLK